MKFKVIKDLVKSDGFNIEAILETGTIIDVGEDGYVIEKLGDKILYDNDFLSKPDYFKKIDELEFKISEIDQSEEDIIKRYRIQLDVKTSMSKLKQIQKEVEKIVSNILEN